MIYHMNITNISFFLFQQLAVLAEAGHHQLSLLGAEVNQHQFPLLAEVGVEVRQHQLADFGQHLEQQLWLF